MPRSFHTSRLVATLVLALTAYANIAQAADIVTRPPAGSAFSVRNNGNTVDRLRVDETTGTVRIPSLTTAANTGMNSVTCFDATGILGPCAPGAISGGISTFGYTYELATIVDATVVGGADIPFSNNGPLSSIMHTAGTTVVIIPDAGTYEVDYSINITAGVGSQIAVAVNGTVDASTSVPALVPTGHISGKALLSLASGDIITLRNNSAIPLTLSLAPSVGAQLRVVKLN